MNIIEKLKSLNVEITPEIEKALGGEFISTQEHEKKLARVEIERDKFKEDFETASNTLKGFDGKDFDAITKERDEWKVKAEKAEKDFAEKLAKRDYSDAIKDLVQDIKFSSNSAKKAFMGELEANPLKIKDGKVEGFDDFLKAYKETDADAFVKEETKKAVFTSSIASGDGSQNSSLTKMREVMGLK